MMDFLRKHLCKRTFISCEQYAEYASREIDGKLTPWQRLLFKGHHVLCMVCRRFRRQLRLIDEASACLSDHQLQGGGRHACMSEERKEKIRQEMSKGSS